MVNLMQITPVRSKTVSVELGGLGVAVSLCIQSTVINSKPPVSVSVSGFERGLREVIVS